MKSQHPKSSTSSSTPATWLSRQSTVRLLYTAIACLVLAAILLGATLYSQHHHRAAQSALASHGYKLGSSLTQGLTTMRLESVSYQKGQGHFSAPNNKRYAVATLSITNRSDHPINVLPTTDTYVKDSAGNVVYLTPFNLSAPFRAGELLPGETVRGELSYLVPASGSLKFYIDAIWSGGVLSYALR